MELQLEIGLIAVVIAVASLWLTLGQRTQVSRLVTEARRVRQELLDLRSDLAAAEQRLVTADAALVSTREELQTTTRRLAELSEPAPPPLPRGRTLDLDDLRAQLRAAHREGDDAESEPESEDT